MISLVTLAATAAVIFYAFNEGLPFVHKFTVHALVSNSVNVRQDDPVRIAGIDVGTVTGTSPAGEATEINFTMDSQGLPLHRDATLVIRDRLFLEGSYYLDLDPGSPDAPIAKDGFTIPLSQTSSPVQFYNVLSMFNQASRSSLAHLLRTLNEGLGPQPGHPQSDSGAGGLKQLIPQLTPVLKDVAWVSQSLRGTHPGDLENLLSSTSEVTSTLAVHSPELVALVRDLNVTSGALASADGALARTISGLDETLRTAPPSLVAIDRALPATVNLGDALTPSLRAAPPILEQATGTVAQLQQVVAPTERTRLIASLKAAFVQFPSVLTQLATAFPTGKPVTDCLRTHITPILRSHVPDGALSSGLPVWQDFVHFLPGVSGATGGFDANGPYTRVLVGAGTNSLSGGSLSGLGSGSGTSSLTSGLLGSSPLGGLLGSSPLLGQLVGSSPPGGGQLLGASPSWVGTLTPSDYRPDQPCTSQPLPSLAAPARASDLVARRTPQAKALSLRALVAQPPAAGHRR